MTKPEPSGEAVVLGLRPNLGQFSLLILVNAFVGAMVGLERTILPLLAEDEFGGLLGVCSSISLPLRPSGASVWAVSRGGRRAGRHLAQR